MKPHLDRRTVARSCRRRRRAAFTLLELVMAITVLALVSVAVMAVFSTGTRSFRMSNREVQVMQRARYSLDAIERDLGNLFYLDEDKYNVQARQRLEEYQEDMLEAEKTGDWEEFERRYKPRDNDPRALDDPNYRGNPFEEGRIIDLQMVGEEQGKTDKVTFAIKPATGPGEDLELWGLARVTYTVTSGLLVRSVEGVEVPPRSWDGEEQEKPIPPRHAILAEGVVAFDLAYAFWWDYQWYETTSWESSDRSIRNPKTLLGDYDDDEETNRQGESTTGDSDSEDGDNDSPFDQVPAYVRIHLELEDPENPGRTTQLMRIVKLPTSQETWFPNIDLDEEERDMERDARDTQYVPVFPGALRKQAGVRR